MHAAFQKLFSLKGKWAFSLLALVCAVTSFGQTSGVPVEILRANTMSIQKVNDSVSLTILEGDVMLKQGSTIFKCNRCVKNDHANTFEAWGNVHINDSDTTDIYSNHLRYLTNRQIAYLNGDVKLTDGHAVLTTPSAEYNMATNIATYRNGGKVVNQKTVITSRAANYYTDIKDVIFMENVRVNDPAYNIIADSLLYNTDNQIARFITYTTIRDSANRTITTREGFYNLRTGDAEFGQRSMVNDNNKTTVIADSLTLTEEFAQAKGQAVVVDSVRGTIIIADLIYQNRITEAVLATRNPLMIIKQDNDSIYVTADTLFSAKLTDLYNNRPMPDTLAQHTPQTQVPPVMDSTLLQADPGRLLKDSLGINTDSSLLIKDSTGLLDAGKLLKDSAVLKRPPPASQMADSAAALQAGKMPDAAKKDSLLSKIPPGIAAPTVNRTDTAGLTTKQPAVTTPAQKREAARLARDSVARDDSTNRYFEAFHNVKIYSDSVQAVSDSLFYSFRDSTFRLYKDPVVWGQNNNQITGDTLFLFTKNKQPYRFEAIRNAFMLTHLELEAFNQIKSSRIDGFFTNGNLDSIRAKGSVQAIYYLQDEDSAYTGVNHVTQTDIIDAYIVDKQLKKVVLRGEPKGVVYPIRQKRPGEMQLEGFRWREAERPKTKYDLL